MHMHRQRGSFSAFAVLDVQCRHLILFKAPIRAIFRMPDSTKPGNVLRVVFSSRLFTSTGRRHHAALPNLISLQVEHIETRNLGVLASKMYNGKTLLGVVPTSAQGVRPSSIHSKDVHPSSIQPIKTRKQNYDSIIQNQHVSLCQDQGLVGWLPK